MDKWLGGTLGTAKRRTVASVVAALPMRMGGLVSRGAESVGACRLLGLMGGCLLMIAARLPSVADPILEKMGAPNPGDAILSSSSLSSVQTDRVSSADPVGMRAGARSPTPAIAKQGEWPHV